MTPTATSTAVPRVVCAVDVGSTLIKASLWRGTDRVLAKAVVEYPSRAPRPDGANVSALRAAVSGVIRTVCAATQPDLVAVTAQMAGLAMLDEDGNQTGPLLSGVDARAPRYRLPSDLRISGCADTATTGLAKYLWYAESWPGRRRRIARVGGVKELILHGLTGRWVTDRASAGASGFYNLKRREWSAELLSAVGLSANALPELAEPDAIAGPTLPQAREWGVRSGVPVMVGIGDGPAASISVGAVGRHILCLSCGTTIVARVLAPGRAPKVRLPVFTYEVANQWQCVGLRFTVDPATGKLIPTGQSELRIEPAGLADYLRPFVDAFHITEIRAVGSRHIDLPASWPVRYVSATDGGRALALFAHGVRVDDIESIETPQLTAGYTPIYAPASASESANT